MSIPYIPKDTMIVSFPSTADILSYVATPGLFYTPSSVSKELIARVQQAMANFLGGQSMTVSHIPLAIQEMILRYFPEGFSNKQHNTIINYVTNVAECISWAAENRHSISSD